MEPTTISPVESVPSKKWLWWSLAVALLAEGNAITDTDLRPLSGFELSKDYAGAIGILNEALRVNAEQAAKNAELVRVSGELKNLSGTVKPAVVGDKAKTAFGLLDELARSQEAYLDARKQLFEAAKAHYADLAAKKEVAAPEELNTLAAVVTAGLKKTIDLAGEFQKAIQEFDAPLAAK